MKLFYCTVFTAVKCNNFIYFHTYFRRMFAVGKSKFNSYEIVKQCCSFSAKFLLHEQLLSTNTI